VEKNLVVNHDRYGIVTTMLPDKNIYMATDNIVRNNTVAGTGLADFLLVGPLTAGDCYESNKYSPWSVPVWPIVYHTCSGLNLPFSLDMAGAFLLLGGQADAVRNIPPGVVDRWRRRCGLHHRDGGSATGKRRLLRLSRRPRS
jgi:hypothetical protein